jgi:hypothetical protein
MRWSMMTTTMLYQGIAGDSIAMDTSYAVSAIVGLLRSIARYSVWFLATVCKLTTRVATALTISGRTYAF